MIVNVEKSPDMLNMLFHPGEQSQTSNDAFSAAFVLSVNLKQAALRASQATAIFQQRRSRPILWRVTEANAY